MATVLSVVVAREIECMVVQQSGFSAERVQRGRMLVLLFLLSVYNAAGCWWAAWAGGV